MGQDPLLNASNKEKTNAQTQIEEDIYDYQIDGKNYRHLEIYDCAQTSSEHKQKNPIKLERPKEAITTEQNSLDNTSDNERNNIEGDIINQEQPEITDPVNAYQNPEPMSQSILSLLQRKYLELKSSVPEKDILELERFSREREKEIVKRNNNKNLERSFVDEYKDAAMHNFEVYKEKDIFELEKKMSIVDVRKEVGMLKEALKTLQNSLDNTCDNERNKALRNAQPQIWKDIQGDDGNSPTAGITEQYLMNHTKPSCEVSPKMWLLDGLNDADLNLNLIIEIARVKFQNQFQNHCSNQAPFIHNIIVLYQELHNKDMDNYLVIGISETVENNRQATTISESMKEMANMNYDPELQFKINQPNMFGNPYAMVIIKLDKFSKTYELKTQLKAFVKNNVNISKPVTLVMLRSAASIAGPEIEELFLRSSNSQSITIEDLTYEIYFPDDCRYLIMIPTLRNRDRDQKIHESRFVKHQTQRKN